MFIKCVVSCLILFKIALCQELNAACVTLDGNSNGVCRLIRDCPQEEEKAKNGISPKLCGFHLYTLPIICCPSAPVEVEVEVEEKHSTGQSMSEQKCAEYSRLVTSTYHAGPLTIDSINHTTTFSFTNCSNDGVALISEGLPAAVGEFPFMAAIGYRNPDDGNKNQWLCGGTLISEFYVLTAAHCITHHEQDPVLVRLGDLNLESDQDGAHHKDYEIENKIVHEHFDTPALYNDIALIKLSTKVEFTDQIRPACLWTKPQIENNKILATGWGATGYIEEASETLLKVQLLVYNNSECSSRYNDPIDKDKLPRGIQPTMLCAGDLKSKRDTCQGDSGGPLLTTPRDKSCIYYAVGITSLGKKCGFENQVAVYTRVSEYIGWIESKIW